MIVIVVANPRKNQVMDCKTKEAIYIKVQYVFHFEKLNGKYMNRKKGKQKRKRKKSKSNQTNKYDPLSHDHKKTQIQIKILKTSNINYAQSIY
jgi:phage regulator Rha-like protein